MEEASAQKAEPETAGEQESPRRETAADSGEAPAQGETSAEGEASARQEKASEPPETPLPPPTFEFLVLSLRSQAEMQLGLFPFETGKERPKPHLPLARHTIDLMAMLEEKTRGNLDMQEKRLLENSLTELRFRYVQAVEATRKQEQEAEAGKSGKGGGE